MTGTFKLPSGSKIRVQSQRRFVVVSEYVPGQPRILYRTDDVNRAVRKLGSAFSEALVLDTVGRKVRVGPPRPLPLKGEVEWVDA